MRNWEEWHENKGNKEEMSEIKCIANTCLPRLGRQVLAVLTKMWNSLRSSFLSVDF